MIIQPFLFGHAWGTYIPRSKKTLFLHSHDFRAKLPLSNSIFESLPPIYEQHRDFLPKPGPRFYTPIHIYFLDCRLYAYDSAKDLLHLIAETAVLPRVNRQF